MKYSFPLKLQAVDANGIVIDEIEVAGPTNPDIENLDDDNTYLDAVEGEWLDYTRRVTAE